MKIFAKRKKTATPIKAESSEDAKIFESDKIVEELLQQDQTAWNAKQRRMIKRYQDRKAAEKEMGLDNNVNDVKLKACDATENHEEPDDNEARGDDADCEDDDDDDDDHQVTIKVETDDGEKDNDKAQNYESKRGNLPTISQVNEPETSTTPGGRDHSTKATKDDEMDELLQQLNSKQRRLLSRRLEREGIAIRDEIRREALALREGKKEEDEKAASQSARDNADKGIQKPNEKQKKSGGTKDDKVKSTKRKQPDWGSLPTEERMRREEQRKLQQEATARMKEETSSSLQKPHRHPLNSERRRANRRKPKWTQRKAAATPSPKTTHNSSGFHIRKKQKV